MRSILIQAWTVFKYKKKYYLPYTQQVYLNEITKYHDKIYLLSPVVKIKSKNLNSYTNISNSRNIVVKCLYITKKDTYLNALKNFWNVIKAYKNLNKNFKVVYIRYPAPFGWLHKFFLKKSTRIIHFVGSPLETILKNPNASIFKKFFFSLIFFPEYLFFLWSCKGSKVFTNGKHIQKDLLKFGIKSQNVISSTLQKKDFYYNPLKKISFNKPKLIYVGYLRKAKGINLILKAFEKLQKHLPKSSLTIVGEGEMQSELKKFIRKKSIKNIRFLGHIDKRNLFNNILRKHDVFCFASLSEGSPRVILEAMANGLNVISTPVGSLPTTFKNNKEIVYFGFNNYEMLLEKIFYLIKNHKIASKIRKAAFLKAQNYKIQNFLNKIFNI